MTDYPEKTCDIDRLVRHPKLVAAAIAGQKTQQRRDGIYGWPDETFELAIGQIIIVPDGVRPSVARKTPRVRQLTPDAGTVVASGTFVWPAGGEARFLPESLCLHGKWPAL